MRMLRAVRIADPQSAPKKAITWADVSRHKPASGTGMLCPNTDFDSQINEEDGEMGSSCGRQGIGQAGLPLSAGAASKQVPVALTAYLRG